MTEQYMPDVLVVGAGGIGCSIARELAERGAGRVVVLERSRAGAGSTSKAAGGLREQFSTEINVRFSQLCMPYFRNAEDTLGGSIAYEETGYIFLARSDAQAEAFRRNVDMQRSLGVDSYWMSPDDLERNWPYLQLDGISAGSWCPTDALIDQVAYMELLAARTRDAGVELREGVTVTGLINDGGRVTGVQTEDGPIHAGIVVLAAGVWSPEIASTIGIDLPVSSNRREIFTSSPVNSLPRDMPFIADFDIASYVRRDANGFRMSGKLVAGTAHEAPVDMAGGPSTLEWATTLIPALSDSRITGGWAGLTEITPDHHALLGPVEGHPGLIVATGFSGHGLMHAPVTGVLIAELILDGQASTLDISSLAPDRFQRGEALAETMVAPAHEQGDIVTRPADR